MVILSSRNPSRWMIATTSILTCTTISCFRLDALKYIPEVFVFKDTESLYERAYPEIPHLSNGYFWKLMLTLWSFGLFVCLLVLHKI